MSRPAAVGCLLLTTVIWGFAFVAQKSAAEEMGALTFVSARYLLAGVCILPFALAEYRGRASEIAPRDWKLVLLITIIFFTGTWLQQVGLKTTSATNAGFLTGLYVFFVPLILLIGFREKPHPAVWVCAPLALVGLYFLNGGIDRLRIGDALIIACAVCWAGHILLLGYLARVTALPVFVAAFCFTGAGVLATPGALVFETPHFSAIVHGWFPIVYSSVLSTAVAFSLQALGQQHLPSANAAIILSAESLFAALGGALFLGERLTAIGYAGAGLIFAAIFLVEAVPAFAARAVRGA
ncbi:MAG: DMT family transporter [Verrucomicrobia bacterium]|nr:DMT family transporter [Verrucomicrobiota bacterium]